MKKILTKNPFKNPFKKLPKKKRVPAIILGLAVMVAAILVSKNLFFDSKANASEIQTAKVTLRDINTTITGSGSLISSNLTSVPIKANGTITKINFKEGETVKKGQLLCTIDSSDIKSSLSTTESNLNQLLKTQSDNAKNYSDLNSKAPINGQIVNLAVGEGDTVPKNGALYTIADSDHMKLTVPFNESDISKIKIGDKVNVNLQSTMQSIVGKVVYKSNASYSTQAGGVLYNVEVELGNPGSLTEGVSASVDIERAGGTISSTESGTLSYLKKTVVKSVAGGTVNKVNVRLYEKVRAGQVVVALNNDELESSIENTKITIKDAREQLETVKEQLTYYTITAPMGGVITTLSYKVGDTAKSGDTLTTITDNSHMEFEVTVDELDISKLKVGQKVNVTLDAISQTSTVPLIGQVANISVEGTSSNGVTTYPATIKITGVSNNFANRMRNRISASSGSNTSQSGNFSGMPSGMPSGTPPSGIPGQNGTSNSSNTNSTNKSTTAANSKNSKIGINTQSMLSQLKDGMNANAEIMISENTGVLTVPLEAIVKVGKTSYVMVQSDAATIKKLKASGDYIDLISMASTNSNSVSGNNSSNKSSSNSSTRKNRNSSNSNSYSNNSSSGSSSTGSTYSSNSTINKLKENVDYYKNSIPTVVEIGVNNDTYVQITSGLSANQTVLLPPVTVSSGSSNTSSTQSSGLGGMMSGSSGGPPDGGNFQGGQNSSSTKSSSSKSGGSN